MPAATAAAAAKLAEAKKLAAATKTANGTLLEDPLFAARLAELETELLALEVTQLRVVAGSADGKPNPISSLVKLRGSELQQSATELLPPAAGGGGPRRRPAAFDVRVAARSDAQ